ncbi:MAG: fucose isomerase, partial [Gammaproteobacteria bacterium]
MGKKIAVFWPGDYRELPNKDALPEVEAATQQLEKALKKLGADPYRIKGYITKPNEAIEKLSNIDDPLIGIYAHWVYGPHTTDGVVGKDNPLLLVSNFSGTWPGLVGLLNTAACLESVNRKCSRIWSAAEDWCNDKNFMRRLSEWYENGCINYSESEISYQANIPDVAQKIANQVFAEIKQRRILALMFGDTSMGMINGYFGPRLLNQHGFTEHKIDQAWIIDRGRNIKQQRIDDAYEFVKKHGVTF